MKPMNMITMSDRQVNEQRKNLVIVRAGDNSLHPEWLAGEADRSWDIVVNYYGADPELYRQPGVTRIDSKGAKWPALHDLIMAHPQFLADYDYIWLPDDDLRTTKDQIDKLFVLCRTHDLGVAQPALTWNSHYGHLTTLQNHRYRLRFTNYVEVMAPCFAARVLRQALPLLNFNLSGWGLDFVWPKLVENPERQIAIIDDVTVWHTRPVGGPNYKALKERGVSPWDELRDFCRANGIDEEPIIKTHAAITRNGKIMDAQRQPRRFALSSLAGYLPAIRDTPDRNKMVRRMGGMAWKAMRNIPDRVAELPMVGKKTASMS